MLCPGRLAVLRASIASVADLVGDMAELGVYKGGSARVIHEAASHRRLHLFDTFTGLPAPSEHDTQPEGRFPATASEVMTRLAHAPVTLHSGRFPDSVQGMTLPPLVFVHVDADLYQSTRDAVQVFWSVLVPGGVMVFDDYGLCDTPGVETALRESGLPVEVLPNHQAVVRKAAA